MPDKPSARIWTVLAALLVTIPGLYWLAQATYAASYSPFGRDQGIFQYFAWAVRQGDVLYRDIRDVNGPLTTYVHLIFQLLGGEDEHRFRVLDLIVTGLVFAFVGASLPGLRQTRATKTERALWGLAGWSICSSAYLWYSYWDISQRETFATWFLLGSLATQLLGASPSLQTPENRSLRAPFVLVFAAGALAVTASFGKPTFIFFFPAQLITLLWDDEASMSRRRRFTSFTAGCVVGGLLHLGLLAIFADLRAFVQIAIFDAPVLYRYIWARAIPELFVAESIQWDVGLGLAGTAVLVTLILLRQAPRRLLAIALLPLGALANVIAQRKGFWYHYQPLTIAVHVVWLVILVWLSETTAAKSFRYRIPALALALMMGAASALEIRSSPHKVAFASVMDRVRSSTTGKTEQYFALWTEEHFRPWEMRQAAQYIQEHTLPTDRIQVYGLDPYFWFLARRLSTTPYVYAYDLNVSAALAGGTGAKPDEPAKRRILDMQRAHASDLATRLDKRPPAAFVFIEHAPMTSYWDDGPRDLAEWCPAAGAWVEDHYQEAIRFGVVRVFLPNEVNASEKPAESEPRPVLP